MRLIAVSFRCAFDAGTTAVVETLYGVIAIQQRRYYSRRIKSAKVETLWPKKRVFIVKPGGAGMRRAVEELSAKREDGAGWQRILLRV
jgi:hypothetical protein